MRLYAAGAARGKSLGMTKVTRSGATWTGTCPDSLKLGLYTAVTSQKDDVGHTATTRGNTFLIVPETKGRRCPGHDLDRDATDPGAVARRPILARWPIIAG